MTMGPSRVGVVLAMDAGSFDRYVAGMTPRDREWCESMAMEYEVMRDCLGEWHDLTTEQAWEKVKEAVL